MSILNTANGAKRYVHQDGAFFKRRQEVGIDTSATRTNKIYLNMFIPNDLSSYLLSPNSSRKSLPSKRTQYNIIRKTGKCEKYGIAVEFASKSPNFRKARLFWPDGLSIILICQTDCPASFYDYSTSYSIFQYMNHQLLNFFFAQGVNRCGRKIIGA